MIKPSFKKEPLNFSPHADDDFKKHHPIAYFILVCIGLILMLSPLIPFYLLTIHVFGGVMMNGIQGLVFLIGSIGSLILGSAFFLILGAFLKQYPGHIIVGYVALVGIILMLLSLGLLYLLK